MSMCMKLSLYPRRGENGELLPMPPVPRGVPRYIDELEYPSYTMNDAILLGETFGIDGAPAIARNDAAFEIYSDGPLYAPDGTEIPYCYPPEDLPVLLKVYREIADVLTEAVDEEGEPRGELGQILEEAPYLRRDDEGCLVFDHRYVSLRNMRQRLLDLCEMLEFAVQNGLTIRVEYW